MDFRSRTHRSANTEPEINLIPFIDVLLVVLIFLMLSTTYSKFTELQLKLPTADTQAAKDHPNEVIVSVSSEGVYAINKKIIRQRGVLALSSALTQAAEASKASGSTAAGKEPVVIISADAQATHQAVISVMEAARQSGLNQITFATQKSVTGSAAGAL
ncbi:MAG: biopolymer transporter ExbD [Burkholderiaceae bacterium]|nr:biopolymer transporter ExbD [Burkholderiaceae bacterium]